MDGKMEGSLVKFLLYPRLKLTLVNYKGKLSQAI